MSDCQVMLTAHEGYLRGALERELEDAQMRSARKEEYPHKIMRQRFSTESSSSRASFTSSSRSSSLSSLLEQGSPVKTMFSERVSGEAGNVLCNKSLHVDRQSLDLRDSVEDSMEAQNLSTEDKTIAREVSDIFLVSGLDMKQGMLADVMNSSLKESAGNASYYGREINRASYDSVEGFNRTSKFQDFPKLSLGCKETDLNSKSTEKDFVRVDDNIQTTQGNQVRVPSVVAKLMGLETLPDSALSSETDMGSSSMIYDDKDIVRISSSFNLSSGKNSWKERNSLPWKVHDGSTKTMSLFPIEPAPWKNVDKARIQRRMAPRSNNGSMKVPYSEIEKRLKDLEFLVSGKNLGETKQMMEEVQLKGLPENASEGQCSNFRIHEDNDQSVRSVENPKPCLDQVASSKKFDIGSSTNDEFPIAITKPAKCNNCLNEFPIDDRNCSGSGTTGKEPSFGNGKPVLTVNSVRAKHEHTTKVSQCSTKLQQMSKDGSTGPGKKSSGSIISPRMQQKKLDIVENRSRPPTPPDSMKSKTQSNKKQSEPKSSVGRRRLKNLQTSDDKLSESSVDSSSAGNREIQDTAQSGETSVNSRRSSSTGSVQSPCMDVSKPLPSGLVKKKFNPLLIEEESAEHVAYLSPVSVLDCINKYKDSLSSPTQYVRKIAGGTSKSKDGSVLAQQSSENGLVSTSSESGSTSEINRKRLKDIDGLVQKLRSLNSDHDEARVDYIASLCENSNPDHRYVSEILLASGLLLRDFTSNATDYQLHSSEYPLNPELFLVVERTKASSSSNQECPGKKTGQLVAVGKVHRKLIFDTANEILARKLAFAGSSSKPWSRPLKLARSLLTAQKLLREVCSEIDELQNRSSKCSSKEDDAKWKTILFDDVMHHSESWTNFDVEISGAVLDIERLIFKDLVKEIVVGG